MSQVKMNFFNTYKGLLALTQILVLSTANADVSIQMAQASASLTTEAAIQIEQAKSAFTLFCKTHHWEQTCKKNVVVILNDHSNSSPNLGHTEPLAGYFIPSENKIEVSLASQDLAASLFHELVHWAHYSKLTSPDWFTSPPPELAWALEAVPFLAYLQSPLSTGSYSNAEASLIESHLAGSLASKSLDTAWYGLVGLWTRYLHSHIRDSQLLFQKLSQLTPENPDFDPSTFEFYNEGQHPLPEAHKKLENLFQYFLVSLIENTSGINPWNLFQISPQQNKTPIIAQKSRWSVFTQVSSTSIPPMGFFFLIPSKIPPSLQLQNTPDLRLVLWRGRYRVPINLNIHPLPKDLSSKDRVLVYNPTLTTQTLFLRPQEN